MIAPYDPDVTCYAVDSDSGLTGPTGTWPEYDPTSIGYWEYTEPPIPVEPDVILKNKGPELEPKPTWKLTPVKSITVRPELRIKQPVARAGYRRGQRV